LPWPSYVHSFSSLDIRLTVGGSPLVHQSSHHGPLVCLSQNWERGIGCSVSAQMPSLVRREAAPGATRPIMRTKSAAASASAAPPPRLGTLADTMYCGWRLSAATISHALSVCLLATLQRVNFNWRKKDASRHPYRLSSE